VNSVENGIKEVTHNTVALANDGAQELKSAYDKVSSGVSTAANGIGSAASAIAGYADAGLSASVQVVSALV
jgi:X-X-X-Leu-X-X-Gly heptad repeat protein